MIKVIPKLQTKKDQRERFKKGLARAAGSTLTVGVHEDAGTYDNSNARVSQVALWLEFGTRYMPARPFLGPAIDDNAELIQRRHAEAVSALCFEGKPVSRTLARLGFLIQVMIQNKIRANPPPPLSGTWSGGPSGKGTGYLGYKRRHGQGQRTLIATGTLLRSIRYQVKLGERAEQDEAHADQIDTTQPRDYTQHRAAAREEGQAKIARQKQQRMEHRDEFQAFKAKVRAEKRRGH